MPQVIVMGTDNNRLVLDGWIASGQEGEDIAVVVAERLEIALLHACRLQRQLAQLLDQVVAGRMSARAAGLASFELRAGQVIDRLEHLLSDDRFECGLAGGVVFRGPKRRRDRKQEKQRTIIRAGVCWHERRADGGM